MRVAAKELTALILNDERLRAERSDRKSWKSRVMGLDSDFGPQYAEQSQRRQPRSERRPNEEDDAEYRLAIEASKHQEEEDRRKRQGLGGAENDDDLAKAIKLSQEEEERRRRELEDANTASLFDDDTPQTSQPQHTGFNQGYQQGNAVDFWANPIDQQAQQIPQPTGYLGNAYTGFQQPQQPQQTGWQQNFNTGFGVDAFGNPLTQQQQQQQQQQQFLQQQQLAQQQQFAQQQQQLQSSQALDLAIQPGSNNPWSTNNQLQQQSLRPTPTGSNNPFAQNRPQSARPATSSLSPLPEQKTLSNFNQSSFSQSSFNQPQIQLQLQQQQQQQKPAFATPQRELSEHERKLNALLASGDGLDTYGNTGDLRIPAQHTAPGTFINSAGAGLSRINPDATGNNPFLRQQFTGMPSITYGGQPQLNSNPFGAQQRPQQQGQPQDLIQF